MTCYPAAAGREQTKEDEAGSPNAGDGPDSYAFCGAHIVPIVRFVPEPPAKICSRHMFDPAHVADFARPIPARFFFPSFVIREGFGRESRIANDSNLGAG